jgi:hypothetical protein
MAEENTNPEGLNGEEDNNTDESEKDKKFDYSYVKELREEAKKYRTDKAELKKEFEKVQAKLKEIEDAKLTDAQKDKNKISDLEKKLVDIQTEAKGREVENIIVTVAAGKNFVDLEAVKMFALKELASEDEPDKKTVEKVLDKLAKDKPYLVKSGDTTTAGSGNFSRQGNEPAKNIDEMFGDMLKKQL